MCDKKIFKIIENILLNDENPSKSLNKIRHTEQFEKSIFNLLNKLETIDQDKTFHPEGNVWNHVCMVVDKGSIYKEFTDDKRSFMLGTLLHDLGKITTTKWIRGRWRSYDHDKVGANKAREIMNKVSDDVMLNERVEELVRYHMHHIYLGKDLPFSNIHGLIATKNINDIILMFLCDKLGRGQQLSSDKVIVFNDVLEILNKIEKYTGEKEENIRKNISEIFKIEKIKEQR